MTSSRMNATPATRSTSRATVQPMMTLPNASPGDQPADANAEQEDAGHGPAEGHMRYEEAGRGVREAADRRGEVLVHGTVLIHDTRVGRPPGGGNPHGYSFLVLLILNGGD
jgi:hypothetical protein